MTLKPYHLVVALAPMLLAACVNTTTPSSRSNHVLGEEQGYHATDVDSGNVRPVDGFHSDPYISFPAPPVDEPVDTDPKPRPDAYGMKRLSGYSLRQITEALNNQGEGGRAAWYEDRTQYQMRIDTHAYAHADMGCKDVLIMTKPNNRFTEWKRHYVTFCRATPQAPWKLQW